MTRSPLCPLWVLCSAILFKCGCRHLRSRIGAPGGAAPRYCEKVSGRQMAVVGDQRSFVALGGKHRQPLLIRIRVEPDIRNINTQLGRDRKRLSGEAIDARTSDDN